MPKRFSNPFMEAILVTLISKVLIFSLGFAASYIIEGPSSPLAILMRQFCRWDSPHYIDIAKNWYVNVGEQRFFIVFFPLYPLLIRLTTFDWEYVNLSALLVSNLSSIIAVIYLFKLVKLDFEDDAAKRAVFYLSIFPTAYFLCATYAESLFLALAVACMYCARLGRWSLAGLLGMLASLTRITGLSLLPALAIEYLSQRGWKLKDLDAKLLWSGLTLAGFLIYLAINYQVMGNFFTFMEVEKTHWHQTIDPLLGLKRAWELTTSAAFPNNLTLGAAQLTFAALGLLGIIGGFLSRLRPSYNAYMLFAWAMSISTGWWISIPRYMLILFPLFILLSLFTRRRRINLVVAFTFLTLLCFFTVLFSGGEWAF
ncbi:MAG: glycosyltransferase family 39 protein [Candidatus Bathyarchaeia archaeon]